ncbi:1-deoxy-D-xylulose-5-phosphate synthase [Gammaproteobacteria bacterium]|nr:1-deoxy-D-xylulose-5-phosphate synthase [Gammaproteobacteria bacterium]MDC0569753.1 1-deoxy-D-xylulose-5-phosphate synthase [Gammaproteobacteria bacterium]MDC0576814.1 1-deoxy-D-xylulose-5-phosphate synthase [Gammaproteobacteria bacterium]
MFQSIPTENPISEILKDIETPCDIRKLKPSQIPQLADELREFLLYSVGRTGGHFGAGLGVIELTLALHYKFDTPHDRIVWDVGHQTYPHKIITGRREAMESMRQNNGLAPFPVRSESDYDTFGVGHSSTSISAALGMITAAEKKNEKRHVTAVIGDGALTAGMAYEALAHAGSIDKNLLVILNDNQMSISENVGGLRNYLTRIWASKTYNRIRESGKSVLTYLPGAKEFARKAEIHAKGMVAPGSLFEELGFEYFGPVDGHDSKNLINILENLKNINGPKFLHVITTKGKGFAQAEDDPVGFHAINKIKIEDLPANDKKKSTLPSYSKIFGEWLSFKAANDENLVAITPAMGEGSGMNDFSKEFPDRYYDVAIAEQHSVTFAAGLACEGLKPVVAIYSTFLQRAYDQLIHDVALQNLDVLFAIDRAGLVGLDGATHQGAFDLSFIRCIPNMVIMAPSDEAMAWKMFNSGYEHPGPVAIRYPRGIGTGASFEKTEDTIAIGKSKTVLTSDNKEVIILFFGNLFDSAIQAGEEINARVVDMRFIKPIDEELIKEISDDYKLIVTLEDNVVAGGAGSAVNEMLLKMNTNSKILNIGLPDEFIEHGDQEQQKIINGLDGEGITKSIREKLALV